MFHHQKRRIVLGGVNSHNVFGLQCGQCGPFPEKAFSKGVGQFRSDHLHRHQPAPGRTAQVRAVRTELLWVSGQPALVRQQAAEACQQALGLNRDALVQLARNSFEAAFISDAQRKDSLARIDDWVARSAPPSFP